MNFLETITEHKLDEIAKRKRELKISSLSEMELFSRRTVSLRNALVATQPFAVIAEIKRASPSAGTLTSTIDPKNVAREYKENGATAISVLTDERFFCGTVEDLRNVRAVVDLPLMRKEFIIDEYQLFEAKAYGADAVLLIATILDGFQLNDLFAAAQELHLECLVELYDEKEIDTLDFDNMKLVGINNRDLRTFTVDLNRTMIMAKRVPKDITLVSESGIQSASHLKQLSDAGIHAALIGEYLMKSGSPGKTLKKLLDDFTYETAG